MFLFISYFYDLHVVRISQVESCSADVFNGLQSQCAAQFEAVTSCLSNNSDEWAKCAAVRRELEVCSVKSKLGEISKLG